MKQRTKWFCQVGLGLNVVKFSVVGVQTIREPVKRDHFSSMWEK